MARFLRLTRGRRRCRDGSEEARSGHPSLQAPPFAVERFEHVEVDGSTTLLRIIARQTAGDLRPADLELVATAGKTIERRRLLAPPAPLGAAEEDDDSARLQLAFALPSEIVGDASARFELTLGERTVAELTPSSPVTGAEPTLTARLEHERALRINAEEQVADRSHDLADARALLEEQQRRCGISERNLAELRDKLVLAWAESRDLRDVLDLGEARHESTKHEARRRRATERELRVLLGRQQRDLVAARENVERQCEALAAELAKRESGEQLAREELTAARDREIALQDASRSALEIFEQARAEADQTQTLLDQAEQAAKQAAADAETSQAEVESIRAELDEARAAASLETARAEQMSVELDRLGSERAELKKQIELLTESAQTDRSKLQQEIEALRSSEKLLHEQLIRAQKAIESTHSGRRGRMRKALSDAETERKRLESELSGLLLHLGNLEEKLAESKAFDPHASLQLDRSTAA